MNDTSEHGRDAAEPGTTVRAERAKSNRTAAEKRTRRTTRRSRIVAIIAAVLLLALLAFLVWASTPFQAEASEFDTVKNNPDVTVVESRNGVVIAPNQSSAIAPTGQGLVFIAGARVDPAAYAYKLSGVAEAGYTVVIARPILGFGIVEYRPLSTFTDLAPGVDAWAVGGHSLGGVRACQYVADMPAATDASAPNALILFGSYCAVDLSDVDIPVLSLGGSNDGLSTPQKIADSADLIPADTTFVEIAGSNHAGFGDYGVQPGDGEFDTSDTAVRDRITAETVAVLQGLR